MTTLRMDHVGIVVDDLPAAVDFFLELGLTLEGRAPVGGVWVDRIIGLEGVQAEIAMLQTPDGGCRIELSTFGSPRPSPDAGDPGAAANARGLRHVTFEVREIDALVARLGTLGYGLAGEIVRYEDEYRLCYVRGPEGILVELAEPLR